MRRGDQRAAQRKPDLLSGGRSSHAPLSVGPSRPRKIDTLTQQHPLPPPPAGTQASPRRLSSPRGSGMPGLLTSHQTPSAPTPTARPRTAGGPKKPPSCESAPRGAWASGRRDRPPRAGLCTRRPGHAERPGGVREWTHRPQLTPPAMPAALPGSGPRPARGFPPTSEMLILWAHVSAPPLLTAGSP